jgi:hypothetical protein
MATSPKTPIAPTTNAKAQAVAAATPVTPVTRLSCVGTAHYVVLGSKRGLTGGNQPRYGSNNANTLAALLAAQGTQPTITGSAVMAVLKAHKHTDFFGYAMGRSWLALAPAQGTAAATLAAGPV